MPDGAVPRWDRDPQPTPFDNSRSQRFVMLDTVCTFANGEDGFRGMGTGLTLPFQANGRPELLAVGVGTIREGFGRFRGREEGTYVYCGQMSPQTGFTGNVLLRLSIVRRRSTPPMCCHRSRRASLDERDVTYLVFRGQAVPSDSVTPRVGADGRPTGLIVEQGLRLLKLDAVGQGKPRATTSVGPMIGRITANVTFNPMAPGGSVQEPIPFTAFDEFIFHDAESGQRVGSFTADSIEGRVFRTMVLGQPSIRFGGVGRIHEGTGVFESIQGLMTDNSVVMFEPHVSASVYMLRVFDPAGRFSRRVGELGPRPPRWGSR